MFSLCVKALVPGDVSLSEMEQCFYPCSGLALFLLVLHVPIAVAVKTQKANRLRTGSESEVPPDARSFGSLKWPTVGTSPAGDRLKSCRVGFGSLLKTLSHWSRQNRPFRDTLWMLLGVFF